MHKKTRRKGGRALRVLLVAMGVITVIAGGLLGALAFTEGERRDGRNLPIAVVDFGAVPDGTYHGGYEGGRRRLRANEVRVTVSSGRVTEIEVVRSANGPVPEVTGPLFDRVKAAQSLEVDTISGATITSKSFLKSVENALTRSSGS